MDKLKNRRRSGPRTFNRDHAVDVAMRLFWRHGFEGVSLTDLTSAIGIAPPSLYAAFGSKAGLYREALDRYTRMPNAFGDMDPTTSFSEAIENFLKHAVNAVTDPHGEGGCMISSGMLQCGEDHVELALELAERRKLLRDTIALKLQAWLTPERAASFARYLMTVLLGLSTQARDGATPEELQDIANEALQVAKAREPMAHGIYPG
ncbi:transcriptional regulator [Rhizobium sp. Root73]|nr:transcriptional regulator [Rhizobium sp. Root1334]KRC08793.1 transcriptional regulator [Rhizobium sp. Root73]